MSALSAAPLSARGPTARASRGRSLGRVSAAMRAPVRPAAAAARTAGLRGGYAGAALSLPVHVHTSGARIATSIGTGPAAPRTSTTVASIFGVGAPEAMVIGVVALLVFGPKGLADVARSAGQTLKTFQPTIRELNQISQEFQSTLTDEIGLDDIKKEMRTPPPPPTPAPSDTKPKVTAEELMAKSSDANVQFVDNDAAAEAAPAAAAAAAADKVTEEMKAASAAAAWGGDAPAAAAAAGEAAPAPAPAAKVEEGGAAKAKAEAGAPAAAAAAAAAAKGNVPKELSADDA